MKNTNELIIMKNIDIDLYNKKYIAITAKQYDANSRYLLFTCYNQGNVFFLNSGNCAFIRYRKPDDLGVFNQCTITPDGKILVELTEQMLSCPGHCEADILIVDKQENIVAGDGGSIQVKDGGVISTMNFCINIMEAPLEHSEIESSYEFNALNDLIVKSTKDYTYIIDQAKASETAASDSADMSRSYALQSQSYAMGTGSVRQDEEVNNAKYFYEQSKLISESLSGALRPMGTKEFEDLLLIADASEGDMYNISDEFITTSDFKEGAGYRHPAGTNVYRTADGYWDCLAGTLVTGVKGDAEATYHKGNISLTSDDIGAVAKTGDSSNTTVTFSQALSRANVANGESLKTILGKIMKWFSDIANGAAGTLLGSNLTSSKVLVSDANGKVAVSPVTSTELECLDGITGSIQNQFTQMGNNLSTHTHAWSAIQNKPGTFPASAHTHDDRYYTEAEMDTKLSGKSNTSHNHDSRYYTETEVNSGYYSLKDAAEIPAGADLNSYTGFGNYVSIDGARSKTLKNCPWTGTGFCLKVERITGDISGQYFGQRIIPNAYECMEFVRHHTPNDGYTPWRKLMPGEYLPLSGGKLTGMLNIGDKVNIWADGEGGNIAIYSPNGSKWECDAHNENLRFYNVVGGKATACFWLTKEGKFIDGQGFQIPQIQRGSHTFNVGANSIAEQRITFSKSFSGTPTVVAGIFSSTTNTNYGQIVAAVKDTTSGGFVLRIINRSSDSLSPNVQWIATF